MSLRWLLVCPRMACSDSWTEGLTSEAEREGPHFTKYPAPAELSLSSFRFLWFCCALFAAAQACFTFFSCFRFCAEK